MPEKKERTVSYRRAEWFNNTGSATLGGCLKQAAVKLTSIQQRTIFRTVQHIKLASLKTDKDGGFYLHLTVETPGEAASVVPKKAKIPDEIEVSITAPPSDSEFMDGDAFVYLRDNDVCLCTTGMHDTTIRYFLQRFLEKANIRHDASQFDLLKVADISKLKLLQSQGVKEIEIRSTLYEASANYHRRKAHSHGVLGAVSKQIKAVLGNEHDVNSDALRVMLTVKTDRRRKGITLGEKRIQTLASDLIKNQEDGDDYIIVTKTGQRIGPTEIFMRSRVLIDGMGKSVKRDKAWKEIKSFYDVLEEAGALEQ